MAASEVVGERVTSNSDADALSDHDLIAAINGGDAGAFEVLYFRYRDWVVALAFRFTEDNDAALDVLQETFLYVLRKFPGFRLTANFKTFLYPAVRNLSIAARRKAQRYQATEEELNQIENTPGPTEASSATSDLNIVLAELPEEQREVILLRFVDGLSLNEIAEAIAIPLGTVKSRLHNALQALRRNELTKTYFER
jgi:RNA polymerase sigma-70 factor (ECF subfamily)